MNRDWFGDSYDIVKRFFIGELRSLGYSVYVDPMPSGEWELVEPAFLQFLGALHVREAQVSGKSALLSTPIRALLRAGLMRMHRSRASLATSIGTKSSSINPSPGLLPH